MEGMRTIATVCAMLGVSVVIGCPLWAVAFEPPMWQTRLVFLAGIAFIAVWATLRLPFYLGKKRARQLRPNALPATNPTLEPSGDGTRERGA